MLSAALLGAAAAAPAAAQDLPSGISLPEDRELEAKLDDAETFLAEGREAAAVALLQEVAGADPGALVRADSDWLFRGAAEVARTRLLALPESARAHRRELVGEQARAELRRALMPPDVQALERLARRYAGMPAAEQAEAALRELWLDRGYPERAATRGELDLPPAWRAALRGPEPVWPQAVPVVEDASDPRLPKLRARDLESTPTWEYRFSSGGEVPQRSHRVAVGHGLCFATDGREVVALELGSGATRWRFDAVHEAWEKLDRRARSQMMDAHSEHVMHAPVLAEGVLLAVLQEPVPIGRTDSYSRIDIRRLLPARRLYAFDARSGAVLWAQDVPWLDGSQTVPRELAAGPPAVAGGRVYLPVYDARGTIDASMLALDLRTGERLWKRFLMSGQLESNLFGNVLKELAVPPPWADLERVVVTTHLGAVCALDARTGAALWSRLYSRNMVRTFQSGLESERMNYFASQVPACDGKRFLCAPVDGREVMLIDVASGALEGHWDARSAGILSAVIAMGRDVAWASGSRGVRLPLDGRPGGPRASPRLVDEDLPSSSRRWPGVLTRDELLLVSGHGIERLDPLTLQRRRPSIQWPGSSRSRLGPLQATHGMLFVMRKGGITAHATPGALLDVLLADDLDPRQLDEVMPLLDQFGFHSDRGTAQRVARAAERLAEDPDYAGRSTDLRLLAGRAHLDGGEIAAGRRALGALLDAPGAATRVAAATLLVEVLPGASPHAPELQRAVEVLRSVGPETVQLRDGRRAPLGAFLARAGLLVAQQSADEDAFREALVATLLVDETGGLDVDGTPMLRWAADELARLAGTQRHRRALEDAAAARFAQGDVDAALLRAFAPTDAAQKWLRAEIERDDLDRAALATRRAWAHRYGAMTTARLALRDALAPRRPPPLPRSLERLGAIDARGDQLLGAVARPGATFVFLQVSDSNVAEVYRVPHGEAPALHAQFDVLPPGRPVRSLAEQALATEDGVAILYADHWVHLGIDGVRRTRRLPGRAYTAPTRVGEFGAVLAPVDHERVQLVVLDLRSGVPLMERPVPVRPGRMPAIVHDGRHLYVMQANSSQVLRFDLWQHGEALELALDFVAAKGDLDAVTALEGGVALTDSQARQPAIVHARPDGTTERLLVGRSVDYATFRPRTGIAWLSTSRGAGGEPRRQLWWLAPGRETPWSVDLGRGELRVPQVPRFHRSSLWQPDLQVLTLHPEDTGGLRVGCLALGAEDWSWRSTLDAPAFDDLVSTLPQPRRCRDGWLLLLPHYGDPGADTRLDLIALDDGGKIVDRFDTPSRARRSRSREIIPLAGRALLRNGYEILILGSR